MWKLAQVLLMCCRLSLAEIPSDWEKFIADEMLIKYRVADPRTPTLTGEYFQGDMIGISRESFPNGQTPLFNNAIRDDVKRWPKGLVPYVISQVYYQDENRLFEVKDIQRAMEQINALTSSSIKFVKRTSEKDYIFIGRGFGCRSAVGRQGGVQTLTLDVGCLEEIGSIQHELMHALGFCHEMMRSDREDYIIVNWKNVDPKFKRDFEITTDGLVFGTKYDYESVMHYGYNAFAVDKRYPTLIPKQPKSRIGQTAGLSFLDVVKLRRAYKCGGSDRQNRTLEQVTKKETLPLFEYRELLMAQCELLKSGNCEIPDPNSCTFGRFAVYCYNGSTSTDMVNLLNQVKILVPKSPIRLGIADQGLLRNSVPTSLALNIIRLDLWGQHVFNMDSLIGFHLPNLLHLDISYEERIRVTKKGLAGFPKLRALTFTMSTIQMIEKGSFDSLKSLQLLAIDTGVSPFSDAQRAHLKRLHCDLEYSWLRNYLLTKPQLLQAKQLGEIYNMSGQISDIFSLRDIFFPVNCSREDLTQKVDDTVIKLKSNEDNLVD